MLRRLFTLASAVSLVLCLGTSFLWASCRRLSILSESKTENATHGLLLVYGDACFRWLCTDRHSMRNVTEVEYRFLGCRYYSARSARHLEDLVVSAPLLYIAILTAILPLYWSS